MQNWRVVAVLSANLALHNLQRFAPVSMFDEFRAAWNIDYTGAGALFAAYLIAYAAMLFPMGMLADRFDNKKLLMFGAALNVAASVLFALAPNLAVGLLARVLLGVSGAFLYVPSVRYVVTSFGQASRGQSMGWVQFGPGVGQVTGLSLIPLATVHSDLSSAFLIPAVLAGLLLAVQALQLRPTRSSSKEPAGMGNVLATEGFKPFLVFFFLAFMANYAISGWLPTYLRNDFGFGPAEAGLAASLSAIAMSIASPLVGKLSDRLGARKPVLMAGSMLSMICFGFMVFSHDPVIIVPAAMLKGVGSAMTTPVSMMFAGETFAAAGAGVAVGFASTTGATGLVRLRAVLRLYAGCDEQLLCHVGRGAGLRHGVHAVPDDGEGAQVGEAPRLDAVPEKAARLRETPLLLLRSSTADTSASHARNFRLPAPHPARPASAARADARTSADWRWRTGARRGRWRCRPARPGGRRGGWRPPAGIPVRSQKLQPGCDAPRPSSFHIGWHICSGPGGA